MTRDEIERLRETVGCQSELEISGFVVDAKESTKRAIKYRRGSEIIIVTHFGRGWFNPLGEEKGDVFGLVMHLHGCDFQEGCARVAALASMCSSSPSLSGQDHPRLPSPSVGEDWARRRAPWPGSATWRYLRSERFIPEFVIRVAIAQGLLREGPYGSMWASHTDGSGRVTGWESRGPAWRGFATGGAKVLFRLGSGRPARLCVTEAAIDAMSIAAIEGLRAETFYLSTGGGWSPATAAALRALAAAPDTLLVAATDGNSQGDIYADRLRTLAEDVGCRWFRLRPDAGDWNDVLKQRRETGEGRNRKKEGVPHNDQPPQGRLRPAAPALDPADRDGGGPGRVMKD
jgi:hypothetical protein